jgi:hypothetical protein
LRQDVKITSFFDMSLLKNKADNQRVV